VKGKTMFRWPHPWIFVLKRIAKKNKQDKKILIEQIASLERQNKCLRSVVTKSLEKEKENEERIRILQSIAAQRVLTDAERFLKEG